MEREKGGGHEVRRGGGHEVEREGDDMNWRERVGHEVERERERERERGWMT